MTTIEQRVYTPAAVREMDRIAIEELGIPGYTLMTRAGSAACAAARRRFGAARRWLVVCGAGNNAGDGYVIARCARDAGFDVTAATVIDPALLRGDAARARDDYRASGGVIAGFEPGCVADVELIVDAMLGTGLTRDLDGPFLAAATAINAADAPVVAVDIPSGLNGENGAVMGAAVFADLTVTFVGLKQGLVLGKGPDYCGEIVFDGLGIPADGVAAIAPTLTAFADADARALLTPRRRGDHKGCFGHVLVIGGNRGMAGAARLAGEAALHSGAGLVSVATHPESAAAVLAGRPELMCHAVEVPEQLDPLLARATIIALGPGLGRDDWAEHLYRRALGAGRPMVMDADALNALADDGQRREDWVLTPHPGEAGRLLGISAADVQADRLGALRGLVERYGGVVVLKGHGTLAGSASARPWLIRGGNPGMATGGMGDVLTGITAALLAQFPSDPLRTAAAAAFAHARAGDRAAAGGERGLLAGDLGAHLRPVLNPGRR